MSVGKYSGISDIASSDYYQPLASFSDTDRLPFTTRAIYFTEEGSVSLTRVDGSNQTIYVLAGTLLSIKATKVNSTGTTLSTASRILLMR